MRAPDATFQVRQDRETLVTVGGIGSFNWRYAYARSADTRATGSPGQDYLTLRCDGEIFVFALCDGVSQSFFGDLAGRYLGDALVQWLWDDVTAAMDAETMRETLSNWLRELTPEASRLVMEQPIPEGLPGMLVEVLEQKRRMGSETMFVAGRIDLPRRDLTDGRVVLTWMGDSRLRLWRGEREITEDLGGEFRTSERWSTASGPVGGVPHVHVSEVGRWRQGLTALSAYSDGLAELDVLGRVPSSAALRDVIARAGESPTSDDISILDVWIGRVPRKIARAAVPAAHRSEDANCLDHRLTEQDTVRAEVESETPEHRADNRAACMHDGQVQTVPAGSPMSGLFSPVDWLRRRLKSGRRNQSRQTTETRTREVDDDV